MFSHESHLGNVDPHGMQYRERIEWLLAIQDSTPCLWSPALDAWIVTRWKDVASELSSPHLSSVRPQSRFTPTSEAQHTSFESLQRFYSSWLMYCDPPHHTQLRNVTRQTLGMVPQSIVRQRAGANASRVLERLRSSGGMEVVSEYAAPVATKTLLDVLGLNPEAFQEVIRWSNHLVTPLGQNTVNQDQSNLALGALQELRLFIGDQARQPIGSSSPVSALVSGQVSRDINTDEAIALVGNLLIDGHQPITSVIASALHAFVAAPGGMAQFNDSSDERVSYLVEESLRLHSPFQYCSRRTLRDTQVCGTDIQQGSRVLLMLAAANRDPHMTRLANERHMAFGYGRHYCVGASMARLISNEAIRAIVNRLPTISAVPGRPTKWIKSLGYHAIVELHVEW